MDSLETLTIIILGLVACGKHYAANGDDGNEGRSPSLSSYRGVPSQQLPPQYSKFTNYLPVFRPTQQNLTVRPGQTATLVCKVDNLGTRTVSWHRTDKIHPLTIGLFTFVQDRRISVDYTQRTNEWSLSIQEIVPDDDGTYQCLISSKELENNTYNITLKVKVVHVTGESFVEKGGEILLRCNATGKPNPPHDIDWYKDGVKLESKELKGARAAASRNNVRITKKIETRALISELRISRVEISDEGDYECRSTNGDSDSRRVHILLANSHGISSAQLPNVKRGTSSEERQVGAKPIFGAVASSTISATSARWCRQLLRYTSASIFVTLSCMWRLQGA